MPALSPFEAAAATYDRDFTERPVPRLMRRAVWRRLDAAFAPGSRVLELGCGTGEDALHLAARGVSVLATDAAEAMCAEAKRKIVSGGMEERIEVRCLRAEEAGSLEELFDGAFADFGVVNCVADLPALAEALAARLRPGAPLLLCAMGRYVPMEWLYFFLMRGAPGSAFRRLAKGPVDWRGLPVHYRSVSGLARAFAPRFALTRASALGAFLPPPYAAEWVERRPGILEFLERWERRLETLRPLPALADHVLLELRRT